MWNEIVDEWDVLVMPADRYPEPVPVPAGIRVAQTVDRETEQRMLESEFEHWRVPFNRSFPGARPDSMIALTSDHEIAAIGYLAAENQIGLDGYGELLYVVINPRFRGQGLYRVFIQDAFNTANEWGLKGLLLVPNRAGLDDVYERWGALRVGTLRSPGRVRRLLAPVWHPQRPVRAAAQRILRSGRSGAPA